jgi:hypothetical protein
VDAHQGVTTGEHRDHGVKCNLEGGPIMLRRSWIFRGMDTSNS